MTMLTQRSQYNHAVAVGLLIAACQLPISDWRLAVKIANPETHPLPRGGTDLIASQ
jgi:hypothetical protein